MAQRRGKESDSREDVASDEGTRDPDAGSRSAIPELVRKAFAAGFSGFFLTEEAIRKALGDTLPKDWSDFAVDQSTRARVEFVERLSYEIGRAMENIDYAAVLAQLLEGRTLEVSAKVRLRDDGTRGRASSLSIDVRSEDDAE